MMNLSPMRFATALEFTWMKCSNMGYFQCLLLSCQSWGHQDCYPSPPFKNQRTGGNYHHFTTEGPEADSLPPISPTEVFPINHGTNTLPLGVIMKGKTFMLVQNLSYSLVTGRFCEPRCHVLLLVTHHDLHMTVSKILTEALGVGGTNVHSCWYWVGHTFPWPFSTYFKLCSPS